VNGLGGTPLIEQYNPLQRGREDPRRSQHQDRAVARRLLHHEPRDGRRLVTLLVLDDELVSLWDAPVKTAALRWGV
jgi:dihydroxyacetone kinase-like protein